MAATNQHRINAPSKRVLPDPNPPISHEDGRPEVDTAGAPPAGNDGQPVLSVSEQLQLWKRSSAEVLALVTDVDMDVLLGRPVTKDRALAALAARVELAERMRRRSPATETARASGASWTEIDTSLRYQPGDAQLEPDGAVPTKETRAGGRRPLRPRHHRGDTAVSESNQIALVLHADSGGWRRRVGPLAWAALEHVALAAHPDQRGWAAVIGVRDIAAGIGVTKDTAARAVSLLRAAGLVTFEQLDQAGGPRRSGYRLHLPGGIQLRSCIPPHDSLPPEERPVRCPDPQDKHQQPPERATTVSPGTVESAGPPGGNHSPGTRPSAPPPARALQPRLFEPPDPPATRSVERSEPPSTLGVHAPTDPRQRHGQP